MDLILLLEELQDSCLPLLKSKKIQYRCDIDEDNEVYLMGDYNRLKQVCINMIKNSMEALKDCDNPCISISYKVKNSYVYIYIEDNGCGMNKEVLSKIKEPFFTTKGTGTGLGVTISHEVIRVHGGIIRYHSKEGKGTRVEIILPLEQRNSVY